MKQQQTPVKSMMIGAAGADDLSCQIKEMSISKTSAKKVKPDNRKQSLLASELDGFNEDEALEMLDNYHNENLQMLQEIELLKVKITSISRDRHQEQADNKNLQ